MSLRLCLLIQLTRPVALFMSMFNYDNYGPLRIWLYETLDVLTSQYRGGKYMIKLGKMVCDPKRG